MKYFKHFKHSNGFLGSTSGKESTYQAGDSGLIPVYSWVELISSFKGNKLDLHLFIWVNLEKSIDCGGDCSRICTMWKNVYKFWKYIVYCLCVSVLVTQSCPTLCDPMDHSPAGSSVHGTLQARTLEWVAISFSSAQKWKVKVKSLSRVQLFATHGLQPTRLLLPWDFPGNSTGVRCHFLLQPSLC